MNTDFQKVERNKQINLERLGETKINNQGEIMFIVEYNSYTNIIVQFKLTGELINDTYSNFQKGFTKSRTTPSVYGVGIVGNNKNKSQTKSYDCWKTMLRRCYSNKFQDKYPTYKGVSVSDEWLYYPNFEKWYEENYYEIDGQTMCLDKDILVKGNKLYSPKNSIFVPNDINNLFTKRNSKRGDYPIGVSFNKKMNKYKSYCRILDLKLLKNYQKELGYHDSITDAFNVYKIEKEDNIKNIAEYYKLKIPNKLYNAMINYIVDIND